MLIYISLSLVIAYYLLSSLILGGLSYLAASELIEYWNVIVELLIASVGVFSLIAFVKRREVAIHLSVGLLTFSAMYELSYLLPISDIKGSQSQILMAIIAMYLALRIFFAKRKYIKKFNLTKQG